LPAHQQSLPQLLQHTLDMLDTLLDTQLTQHTTVKFEEEILFQCFIFKL
jgi:hypothetical protein